MDVYLLDILNNYKQNCMLGPAMAESPTISRKQIQFTKPICRGCLSSERSMKHIHQCNNLKQCFLNLSDVMVTDSDGLPPWLCWECEAQFRKYYKFRHKILRCHHMLLQLLDGCQNFSEEVYQELESLALPTLTFSAINLHSNSNDRTDELKEELEIKNELLNASNDSDHNDNDNLLSEDIRFNDFEKVPPEQTDFIFEGHYRTEDCNIKKTEGYTDLKQSDRSGYNIVLKHRKSKGRKTRKLENKTDKSKYLKGSRNRERGSRKFIELDPKKVTVIRLSPEQQKSQRLLEATNDEYLKFPFKCTLCFKGFNYEQKLNNHIEKHSKKRGNFKCDICQVYVKTVNSLTTHRQSHTTRYECVACGKRAAAKICILEHYASVHEAESPRYVCHICQKISVSSKTHYAHVRNHRTLERPECDNCGKTFLNKEVLQAHMIIHTGERNFPCPECNKKFRTQTHLQQHALTHSDSRDFYCVECDMRFKSEHTLKQHLLNTQKHVDDAVKHSCGECSRRFTSRATLDSHVRTTHRKEKRFVCGVCDHACGTSTGLRMHTQKVHEGWKPERKHMCHTCGKAFATKFILTNHMRTHTGERPFACLRCSSTFTQSAALRTHTRMVHLRVGRNAPIVELIEDNAKGM